MMRLIKSHKCLNYFNGLFKCAQYFHVQYSIYIPCLVTWFIQLLDNVVLLKNSHPMQNCTNMLISPGLTKLGLVVINMIK